jgi:hypothetical protein
VESAAFSFPTFHRIGEFPRLSSPDELDGEVAPLNVAFESQVLDLVKELFSSQISVSQVLGLDGVERPARERREEEGLEVTELSHLLLLTLACLS